MDLCPTCRRREEGMNLLDVRWTWGSGPSMVTGCHPKQALRPEALIFHSRGTCRFLLQHPKL